MKILIIYATRGGVSKRCAEMLCERLNSDVFDITLCDIENGAPSPEGFDVAVIGGSIRMGSINKKLKKYLRTYTSALLNINTALFLCCGYTENFDDYVLLNIPHHLVPTLGMHCFGGELKPEKLKGFDKFVVKMVRTSILDEDFENPDPNSSPLPEIIPENIWRLADSIRALL